MKHETSLKDKMKNSSTFRSLSDGIRVLGSMGDKTSKSLVKATNFHKVPPKEKHVKRLLVATSDAQQVQEIVDTLVKIIHERSWIRTLKGLQVIHRLIQEGSPMFTEALLRTRPSSSLNLHGYMDTSSGKGQENTPFIRSYAVYIISRSNLVKKERSLRRLTRKIEVRKLFPDANAENPKSLFEIVEPLQLLMGDLLDCRCNEHMLQNGASLGAFSLLLRDSFCLFKILSDAMLVLLDLYFNMNKTDAQLAYEIYEKHTRQTSSLITLYKFVRRCRAIRSSSIPTLKAQPESLLTTMKEYIENAGDTATSGDEHRPSTTTIPKEDVDRREVTIDTVDSSPKSEDKQDESKGNDEPMFLIEEEFKEETKEDKNAALLRFFDEPSATTAPTGPPQGNNPFASPQNTTYMPYQRHTMPAYGGYGAPPPYNPNYPPPPYRQAVQQQHQQQPQSNPFNDDPFDVPAPPKKPEENKPAKSDALDEFLGF